MWRYSVTNCTTDANCSTEGNCSMVMSCSMDGNCTTVTRLKGECPSVSRSANESQMIPMKTPKGIPSMHLMIVPLCIVRYGVKWIIKRSMMGFGIW